MAVPQTAISPTPVLARGQQARLFPGCAFVVGADTAKRIIDPRYYGNSVVRGVSRELVDVHRFRISAYSSFFRSGNMENDTNTS